jgi:hypothetical protein
MSLTAADAAGAYTSKMAAADIGIGLSLAEDVSDFIINIDPEETPLLSALPKKSATAVYHEWLIDVLTAAATNEVLEGAAFTSGTMVARSRISNPCQISTKVYEVTGSMQAVRQYGLDDELAYQAVKAMKELKRDVDLDLWQNTSGTQDSADITGSRTTRGYHDLIPTAHTGDASYTVANMTGDSAEATFQKVLQDIFDDGPMANIGYMRPSVKVGVSRWTGLATLNRDHDDHRVINLVDFYVSDFGTVRLEMDRYMEDPGTEDNDLLVVGNWDGAAIAYLRPFQNIPLATDGLKDASGGAILVEYSNEYGAVNSYGRMLAST